MHVVEQFSSSNGMSSGGRPKDAVWRHFSKIEVGGNTRAKCNHCGIHMVPAVGRMKTHTEKCVSAASSSVFDVSNTPSRPQLKQQNLLNVVRTNTQDQKALDLQLSRAVFSSNSPFSLVNNKEFRKYQSMMRPGISFIDRHSVGGDLLEQVYEEEKEKIKNKFRNERVSLILDGWSTRQNEPIMGAALFCNGEPVFFDAVDTTGHPHTIEYLVELCSRLVVRAQEEWEVKIVGIITDNAQNMKGMRVKMAEQFPSLIVIGCSAHRGNLLAKDVSKNQHEIIANVISVLKWLKNTHLGTSELKTAGIARPPLPATTRWNSLRDSLRYFTENWGPICQIVSKNLPSTDKICRVIESIQLRRAANDLLDLLDPISSAVSRFQSDECVLSEAAELWMDLIEKTPSAHKAKTVQRADEALEPSLCAANLLDPR